MKALNFYARMLCRCRAWQKSAIAMAVIISVPRRVRLPPAVGLLLSSVVLGPHGLEFIGANGGGSAAAGNSRLRAASGPHCEGSRRARQLTWSRFLSPRHHVKADSSFDAAGALIDWRAHICGQSIVYFAAQDGNHKSWFLDRTRRSAVARARSLHAATKRQLAMRRRKSPAGVAVPARYFPMYRAGR